MGGSISILLAIMYSSIFPKPIHSLENGLTIYRLVITSHDPEYCYTIGGPHESFKSMVNYFGTFGILFANMQNQLENFRNFGPPRIAKSIMSEEDELFASQFNAENSDELDLINMLECHSQDYQIRCSDCNVVLHSKNNFDEDMFHKRSLQKAQEDGLNIEYCCPRCRTCNDCRNSHETERLSLREECEDLMVKDSVTLDWPDKQIVCYLPVRGSDEEFLTSNREIADKVLQQQCQKYHKDEATLDIIVKAFEKLHKNKQLLHWSELDDATKKLILGKKVNHWMVWRVVFKQSLSSPARIVFDASTKTKPSPDGSGGGRCLNDLVVKGRVVTLNLTKMVLRFTIGKAALQGDLRQFYASIKLVKDQWNLQRIIYKPDLDPNSEPIEAVITSLIWGVKSVSAQSEAAVIKLADYIADKNPRLAELLKEGRFVDDLGDSDDSLEKVQVLSKAADNLFENVGLSCKGWSYSGLDPPTDVTEGDGYVSIGGMKWHTRLDFLEIPIPPLHFSKKSRGRLVLGTEVFDGHFIEDMEQFVPKDLNCKMILSKKASLFDVTGKFTPVSAKLSLDLRRAIKETSDWNEVVSDMTRSKWVQNFFLLEQLKGLKFTRARMPLDAVSSDMHIIVAGDTASSLVKICGVWGRFKLRNGLYSCQHIISRSLLGDIDSSIPKEELEALTMASNLGWIVRQMLDKWITSCITISDSTISLCWVMSNKNRLSLFHRNRTVQVRRGTDLDHLYHCVSEGNPCDLGTRPDSVSKDDVGPHSQWETGLPWMSRDISEAVDNGILKPAKDLILNESENETYEKGFIFEKSHEILTRGHPVLAADTRADKIRLRLETGSYLFNPGKFKFEKTVRIMSIVYRFIKSFKCRRLQKSGHRFSMLPVNVVNSDYGANISSMNDEWVVDVLRISLVSFGAENPGKTFSGNVQVLITDDDISKSLEYLFRCASKEVLEFNKAEFLKKIAVQKDGIFISKSRILDGQRLQVAAGFEDMEFLHSFKPFQSGFNLVCPVIDRFSPLSYCVADYIHRKKAPHSGYESCYRCSLDFAVKPFRCSHQPRDHSSVPYLKESLIALFNLSQNFTRIPRKLNRSCNIPMIISANF